MRIIHLSDLHLNTFFKDSKFNEIEFLIINAIKSKFDHLIITGDLIDNADEEDLDLLRKLFNKYNLLKSDRLSLTIGNHDIFGGVQKAEDIFSFPQRCADTDYDMKVNMFTDYFKEAFYGCIYRSKNIFPYAKIIDNTLITGMNSIARYSKLLNPFASNGEVNTEQLAETKNLLEIFGPGVTHRIIAIHHHFNKIVPNKGFLGLWQKIEKQTMKLRGKKSLYEMFIKNNVDLILHGHYHQNKEYHKKGLIFSNSGASVKSYKNEPLKFNKIDLNENKIRISVIEFSHSGVKTNRVVVDSEKTESENKVLAAV